VERIRRGGCWWLPALAGRGNWEGSIAQCVKERRGGGGWATTAGSRLPGACGGASLGRAVQQRGGRGA
jgi:hypothetical protein